MKKIYRENSQKESVEELNGSIEALSEKTDEEQNIGETGTEESGSSLRLARRTLEKEKPRRFGGKKTVIVCVLLIIAAAVAACAICFVHMKKKGREELLSGERKLAPFNSVVSEDGSSVQYKGTKYERNDNVVGFLIIGVDDLDGSNEGRKAGGRGQADAIMYGTLDVNTGKLSLLNVSRDSMVDVDTYSESGKFASTEEMQICLAYAYGNDDQSSCENVVKSARRLLFNAPIDFYVAADFPAVSALTDSVGGVKVEILEDLSGKDEKLKKGAVVSLNGKQAMIYVRSRDFATMDSNNNRMLRQKQFATEFLKKLKSLVKSKPFLLLNVYQAIKEYVTTNLTPSEMLYLADLALSGDITSDTVKTAKGEVVQGDEYAEFHPDKDALYTDLLDMLYARDGAVKNAPIPETEAMQIDATGQETTTQETEEALRNVNFSLLY